MQIWLPGMMRSSTSVEPACTVTLTRGFISWRAAALTLATLHGKMCCTFAPQLHTLTCSQLSFTAKESKNTLQSRVMSSVQALNNAHPYIIHHLAWCLASCGTRKLSGSAEAQSVLSINDSEPTPASTIFFATWRGTYVLVCKQGPACAAVTEPIPQLPDQCSQQSRFWLHSICKGTAQLLPSAKVLTV